MTTEPNDSIFTKIINQQIPADIIYEDEIVIAFLTIEPITAGHTLVVPKKPFVNLLDGDEPTLGHMMKVAQTISRTLLKNGYGEGVNIIMNNGAAAGQEVFHAHLHVVPRTVDDGALKAPKHITYRPGEAAKIADNLRPLLS